MPRYGGTAFGPAFQPRRSKYGVDLSPLGKELRTYRGVLYDSKAEAHHAHTLDMLQSAGEIVAWRYHVRLPCWVNDAHAWDYESDFYVVYPDGRVEVHEVKGKETEGYRLKRKILELSWLREHPHIPFVVYKRGKRVEEWRYTET